MVDGGHALVTGGAGFIGTNFILTLLRLGYTVRGTVHVREPKITEPKVEFVRADLTRIEDCKRAMDGMEYVFICSANTAGAAVMATTPLVQVTPNVVMNALLLQAAYEAGIKKVLFISSSAAYPPSGDWPVTESEMFQGDPYDVYYSVGWMKRYSEILCRIYAEKIAKRMPVTVVRPSNVYGPYDKFDFGRSHVTAATIRKVVDRHNPIEVWGTGDDIRDLIYVDDFIDGALRAFARPEPFLAINVASGETYTIKDVLRTAMEVEGYENAEIRFDTTKPTMIPVRRIDTSLAENLLDFRPRVPLREGVKKTVEWYKQNPPPA